MIEQRVNHPKYGSGSVKKTRFNGFELQVQFGTGPLRWIRVDEISDEATPTPQEVSPKPL